VPGFRALPLAHREPGSFIPRRGAAERLAAAHRPTRSAGGCDAWCQAHTGARIPAQNALARAERAEEAASKPVALIIAPANDERRGV